MLNQKILFEQRTAFNCLALVFTGSVRLYRKRSREFGRRLGSDRSLSGFVGIITSQKEERRAVHPIIEVILNDEDKLLETRRELTTLRVTNDR